MTAHRAMHDDDPDVSLVSKDSTKAASNPPPATPTNPAAPAVPVPQPPVFTVKTASIDHSFAAAAKSIGVDARTTATLVRAFRNELDLTRDLRAGDHVSAVFDDTVGSESKPTDNSSAAGKPVAVRIVRGTTTHDVFLYHDLRGQPFYYSKDGINTKPAFERYPLTFTRVSSGFSLNRFDPVLHRWQSHDGVDLAAPAGTPVHATARGVVRFIGRQTGYGKVVVIQNPAPYSTTFAHLSRFAKGLRRGSHVTRDQVIGYVGETGWATGPHLHYEVHVNSVPRDPLTVELPRKKRLRADELQHFKARVAQLTALL
ncbi:M23 family metallopeptidase [Paraburkholderia sp. ZP32-5]|uniref:M23 family metallopeptidase n=1 Tax=Paraburkholderia sp. ZP32-5 TaxID=2883245 RepID=UPI001F388962|nr:M23 family metallopeptidase [Paraburkholderia sp. ZP32-5]